MIKNIFCFPHKLGQKRCGVEKAPVMFANLLRKKHNNLQIHHVHCKENEEELFKNLKNLYCANNLIDYKKRRLNIGGDHSMSLATLAYTLNYYPKAKVLWVDAHPDINSYEASSSKNYHGMPLSFLTGIDKDPRFSFIDNKLFFRNIFYIGIRSLDSFEKKIIDEYNIKYFNAESVNNDVDHCIDILNGFIDNSPFHLSFDVDAFDPSIIPHTGTPVEKGLLKEPGQKLLQSLVTKKNLVNMDLTEMNPDLYNNKNTKDESVKKMFSFVYDTIKPLF